MNKFSSFLYLHIFINLRAQAAPGYCRQSVSWSVSRSQLPRECDIHSQLLNNLIKIANFPLRCLFICENVRNLYVNVAAFACLCACVSVEMNENSKQTQRRYFERQQFIEIFSIFLLCWSMLFYDRVSFSTSHDRSECVRARALLYVCECTCVCACMCRVFI